MRTAVLVSGGVDSAVALARLAEAGEAVEAFYLKVWLEDELADLGQCPWEEDLDYARSVAARCGVPLHVVALQRPYRERVVAYLLRELREGRTPSPDLFCNSRIKFGAFLEALDREYPGRFPRVASGHYAVRIAGPEEPELHRSPDRVKDQTYFLSRLTAEQLARCRFPIGGLTKSEVRARARALDLAPKSRPDSQGICFLGRVRYRDFVRGRLGEREGPVIEEGTGRRLGAHAGHWLFTIGQRRGLGLSGGPWYVVKKDPGENCVLVRRGAGRPTTRFLTAPPHWIGAARACSGERLEVRLRHGPEIVSARFRKTPDGAEVQLAEADPGVAPGQFAVLYRGTRCLGSAQIAAPLQD